MRKSFSVKPSGLKHALVEAAEADADSVFHHYLPITDDLLHGGIYVTCAGRSRIVPGETYPLMRHPSVYHFSWNDGRVLPEFSLMLIVSGRGTFESRATRQVALKEGDAILLFPGVWHRYRPDRECGWEEKWVHFNGELPHKLMEQGLISPQRPILHPADFRAVEGPFDRLLEEVHRDPATNSIYISLLALGAVTAVIEREAVPSTQDVMPANRTDANPIVAAAIDYIWTRSHKVLSVDDVADNVSLSRRTLERHMMAAVGHSILDEIVQCRFVRAERLLRETDLRIKVVVSLAGFGSMQNMRFVFLKRTGMTPHDYRTRYRSQLSQVQQGPVL